MRSITAQTLPTIGCRILMERKGCWWQTRRRQILSDIHSQKNFLFTGSVSIAIVATEPIERRVSRMCQVLPCHGNKKCVVKKDSSMCVLVVCIGLSPCHSPFCGRLGECRFRGKRMGKAYKGLSLTEQCRSTSRAPEPRPENQQ